MSAQGRTSWWPCDAAEHDRELIVELGEEFGPGGPLAMRVLKDLAQQQRDHGRVRTGFRVLRQKTFVDTAETVRAIVEHAASIGALDDLEVDQDGRRFTCRVSGWEADSARGRAAIKKAIQRAGADDIDDDAQPADDPPSPVPPAGDVSPSGGTASTAAVDVSPESPVNRDEKNREEGTASSAIADDEESPPPALEIVRLCRLLATLICRNDPKAIQRVKPDSDRWLTAMRLLIADRGGDIAEVEDVLRWSQADPFWHSNILSPTKLREQFTQLALKRRNGNGNGHLRPAGDPNREERRARDTAALRAMLDNGTGQPVEDEAAA